MVTITDGSKVYTVTNGAFKSVFEKQGFKIYKPEQKKAEKVETKAEVTDDEFLEKLEEKPLNKWNKEEVKKYAELFGINISGTKNIGEARDLIRKFKSDEDEA